MSARLEGRVALVTGGGRGAGAAIARSFARAGAKLVIADSGTDDQGSGADPRIARALVEEFPERAVAFTESIASPSAARAAVDAAIAAYGALDIVVHAASVRRPLSLAKADAETWSAVLRNNLSSAFHLIGAAMPLFEERAKARPRSLRVLLVLPSLEKIGSGDRVVMRVVRAGLIEFMYQAARALEVLGGTANALSLSNDVAPATLARLALDLAGDAGASVSGRHFALAGDKAFVYREAELEPWAMS